MHIRLSITILRLYVRTLRDFRLSVHNSLPSLPHTPHLKFDLLEQELGITA